MAKLRLELRVHQPVSPIDDSSDELSVLVLGLEVAAAPEDQRLVQGVIPDVCVPALQRRSRARSVGLVLVDSTP